MRALALAVLLAGVGSRLGASAQARETIVVFERAGCPHCEHAEEWLRELEGRRPVRVVRRDVVADPSALDALEALADARGIRPVGVPAILVRDRLFVGFDGASTTGRAIEAWLDRSAEPAPDTGGLCAPDTQEPCTDVDGRVADGSAELPLLGEVRVADLGLPLFTIAIGLVDGFNPCAMWVLLFLLSMLVHLKSRARMALFAGTFVLVSAIVYFAFMAAWLELHLLIGISRGVQIALGVFALAVAAVHVKDFIAAGRGPSLSIPESAKPKIYSRARAILRAESLGAAMVMVVGLAFFVNLVELLCTAGLPALYTQVLAAHGLGRLEHLGYLALYVAAYMADDSVMVAIGVVTLSQRKLQERGGRALKLISGLVVGALGIALIFAPEWLDWG